MLLGDQPISKSSEDRLGRADFCRYLANAILDYKSEECIVIGLLGTWGSGKSSILNMIIEFLNKTSRSYINSKKPIIVKFNPWNYPDQNGIWMQFFYNLSSILKLKRLKKFQKLGDKVYKYAGSFIPFEISIDSYKKPISLKLKKPEKTSIDFKKEKLIKDFQKIQNKIIIIIDDIDRLNQNEIKQIFQLIKAFGNLPNIIYIAAFDRKIVSDALGGEDIESGEEYLEKIIQVPFDIPAIPRDKVLGILQFQLNELISEVPEGIWDQEYWINIYHSSIQYFFNTIRDINRYINILKISLPFIINEVNPIDFIAIVCIQVFLPKVYYEIKNNREIFIEDERDPSANGSGEKDYKGNEIVSNIINMVPKKSQKYTKRLLCYLFPVLRNIFNFDKTEDTEKFTKLRIEKRICSPNLFNTYFRLSVPEYEINQKEISSLILASESEEKFSSMMLSLNRRGKIRVVIECLKDRIVDIPFINSAKVISSFLDISDEFKIDDIDDDLFSVIVFICIDLLFRIEGEEERFNILENAINNAKSIYISTVLILKLINESRKKKYLMDGFKVIFLEDLVARKIRSWAYGNNIDKNNKLHLIIYNWAELESKNQVKKFLNNYISSNKGFLSFISSNLQKKYIIRKGDQVPILSFDMDIDKIIDFTDMPVSSLKSKIRNIVSSEEYGGLSDKEKTALKIFTDKMS